MSACVSMGMSISVHESVSVSVTNPLQHSAKVFPKSFSIGSGRPLYSTSLGNSARMLFRTFSLFRCE